MYEESLFNSKISIYCRNPVLPDRLTVSSCAALLISLTKAISVTSLLVSVASPANNVLMICAS